MSDHDESAVVTAERLGQSCASVLGPTLVAAILHGSLTTGDFRPRVSDLDLLLVVDPGLTPSDADALVVVVRAVELGPAKGIDLLVVSRRTAAHPARRPRRELLVGRWPGARTELEVEGQAEDVSDLWPELSMARASGRSILGPGPREVLGEVPGDLVRANGSAWLETWLDRTDDAPNAVHMVLTACRIWRFAVAGVHTTKSSAARWALDRDPSLVAVERALGARVSGDSVTIAPEQVEQVLRRVLREAPAPE